MQAERAGREVSCGSRLWIHNFPNKFVISVKKSWTSLARDEHILNTEHGGSSGRRQVSGSGAGTHPSRRQAAAALAVRARPTCPDGGSVSRDDFLVERTDMVILLAVRPCAVPDAEIPDWRHDTNLPSVSLRIHPKLAQSSVIWMCGLIVILFLG